jgi:hypothetical protein
MVVKIGNTLVGQGGSKGEDGIGLSNSFEATSKADLENVANAGKIAIISSEIDLATSIVTLQDGMTLRFNDGYFSNGTVTGVNSQIIANSKTIFASDCVVNGTWKLDVVYPQWFDVKGDGVTDDTLMLQKTLDFIGSIGGGTFFTPQSTFLINADGVDIKSNTIFDGNNSKLKLIPSATIYYQMLEVYHQYDVVIKNLLIEGDRYEHDYSDGETHEHGLGLNITSAKNILIENVRSYWCTGDSFTIGNGRSSYFAYRSVDEGSIVRGGFDASGVVDDVTYDGYRTVTPFDLTVIDTEYYHFWARSFTGNYDNAFITARIFYYNASDTFLESRDFIWQEHSEKTTDIPATATKAHVWYIDAPIPDVTTSTKIELGGGLWGCRNITLRNFEGYDSRRQGLTVGGVLGLTVEDGRFHHIKGTAPQSGVDIEEGVNRYIAFKRVQFDHNEANFQSPSGNFVSFYGCTFMKSVNASTFASGTGSANMRDCLIIGDRIYLDGKVNIDNCIFRDVVLSDTSTTPETYNSKTFTNCTFEDSELSLWRLNNNLGLVTFNGGIYKNCQMAGDKDIIFNNLIYESTSSNYGGNFNNCEINIPTSVVFLIGTLLKDCIIKRLVEPTANSSITFSADTKIWNTEIEDINPSYNGNIYLQNNVNVNNSTFDIERDIVFGREGFTISGDNVVLNDVSVKHTGDIVTFNGAMFNISNSSTTKIYKCYFTTTDVEGDSLLVKVGSGTPTYQIINCVLENVLEPTDAGFVLNGNILL